MEISKALQLKEYKVQNIVHVLVYSVCVCFLYNDIMHIVCVFYQLLIGATTG